MIGNNTWKDLSSANEKAYDLSESVYKHHSKIACMYITLPWCLKVWLHKFKIYADDKVMNLADPNVCEVGHFIIIGNIYYIICYNY